MEWQIYTVFTVIVLYTVMNRSKNAILTVQCCLATAYRLGVCVDFWVVRGTGISFIEQMAWKTVDVSVALGPNRSENAAWWERAG